MGVRQLLVEEGTKQCLLLLLLLLKKLIAASASGTIRIVAYMKVVVADLSESTTTQLRHERLTKLDDGTRRIHHQHA